MDAVPTSAWVIVTSALLLAVTVCRVQRGIDRRSRAESQRIGNNTKIRFAVIGLGAASILTAFGMSRFEWQALQAWLIAINVAAFVFYGWDKLAAQLQFFRIPESTLHILAFGGGTVGALVGMDVFNHKTSERKRRFQWIFWAIVVLHVVVLASYLRGDGVA